jgi:hypothetical protein
LQYDVLAGMLDFFGNEDQESREIPPERRVDGHTPMSPRKQDAPEGSIRIYSCLRYADCAKLHPSTR